MNVYDFDNTILRGDSTARFFAWCLLRAPRMWLDAPGQIGNAVLFLLKKREKQAFKERMLSFLSRVDVDRELERFWNKNLARVKPFYRRNTAKTTWSSPPRRNFSSARPARSWG